MYYSSLLSLSLSFCSCFCSSLSFSLLFLVLPPRCDEAVVIYKAGPGCRVEDRSQLPGKHAVPTHTAVGG